MAQINKGPNILRVGAGKNSSYYGERGGRGGMENLGDGGKVELRKLFQENGKIGSGEGCVSSVGNVGVESTFVPWGGCNYCW